mmetsp:Transcript_5520/g.5247  ORF Transcript_5520/g.5247 Transcript_5520/m.5247 type:complete len:184 (-) Transcript_5520:280-831(-)
MKEIEALGYDNQVIELQGKLKSVETQRRQHQNDLEKAQTNLSAKMTLFEGLEGRRKREKEDNAQRIESELIKIADLQLTINDILRSLDELNSKLESDGNKELVGAALENEKDSLNLKLQWALEERDNSRNDIKEAIEMFRAKQSEMAEQEKYIQVLREDIKEVTILIREKKTIITELELEIEK